VEQKDGQIVPTPEGLPRMVPFTTGKGEQLKGGLDFFTQQFQQTQAALIKSIEEYQKLVAEDVKLTEQIIGDKGLQQLLFNEQDIKQARVKQEIEDLKPVYINVLVETQLLTKRQKALQARLDEVRKLAFFTQQLQQTQAALMKSIEEYQQLVYQQLVAEDVKLTEQIIGDKDLQQLLFNEQDIKRARVKQEIEDLKKALTRPAKR